MLTFNSYSIQNYCLAIYHLITTKAEFVLTNKATDITALSACQQEEEDTRMMHHAAEQGHTNAYLRTVDSDVVVLAISLCLHQVRSIALRVLTLGKANKNIPVHYVSHMLGHLTL